MLAQQRRDSRKVWYESSKDLAEARRDFRLMSLVGSLCQQVVIVVCDESSKRLPQKHGLGNRLYR